MMDEENAEASLFSYLTPKEKNQRKISLKIVKVKDFFFNID